MSRTYRDVVRGRYNRARKDFDNDSDNHEEVWIKCYRYEPSVVSGVVIHRPKPIDSWHKVSRIKIELQDNTPWRALSHKEQMYVWSRSTPSWWNHTFNFKWKRASDKRLCKMMTLDYDDEWEHKFYYNNKPHVYYW